MIDTRTKVYFAINAILSLFPSAVFFDFRGDVSVLLLALFTALWLASFVVCLLISKPRRVALFLLILAPFALGPAAFMGLLAFGLSYRGI